MTTIHLEMTSPTQLVPAQRHPLELQEITQDSAALIRTLYNETWEPLGSGGRLTWADADWMTELSTPGIRTWIATVNETPAGFVELSAEPNGDVGIVVFALTPTHQGKGLGSTFLTRAVETAWSLGDPTRRVWLQTSTTDHPAALPNYLHRGFKEFTP